MHLGPGTLPLHYRRPKISCVLSSRSIGSDFKTALSAFQRAGRADDSASDRR